MAQDDPQEIINMVPEDIKDEVLNFVNKVMEIEHDKLHMGIPRLINEDLIEALEEIVR